MHIRREDEDIDMRKTWFHTFFMNSMIQIRNVPPGIHRKLKARAALEGVSMSQFILREIERALARPSRQELLAAIRGLSEPELDIAPADVLRQARDAR